MKKNLIKFFVVIFLSVIFFSYTNPTSLPVFLLVIPLLLLFAGTYYFVQIVLKIIFGKRLKHTRSKLYSLTAGMIVALFLLFQSTGGIVLADIILMCIFIVVTYFYLNKL